MESKTNTFQMIITVFGFLIVTFLAMNGFFIKDLLDNTKELGENVKTLLERSVNSTRRIDANEENIKELEKKILDLIIKIK